MYLLKILYFNGPTAKNARDLSNLIIIVTGASNGIGKETALQCLEQGAEVIFACRDEKKTLDLINSISSEKTRKKAIYMNLNLSSFKSVESFAQEYRTKYKRLDMLINNAATALESRETEDKIDETFQVNHFSHVILTLRLLDLVNICNGRIINVTGKIFSISDITSNGFIEEFSKGGNNAYNYLLKKNNQPKGPIMLYSISKLFNVIFTLYLRDLSISNLKFKMVRSVTLHPGVCSSDLMREPKKKFPYMIMDLIRPIFFFFTKTQYHCSQTTMHTVYLNYDELTNGGYYRDCKIDDLIPIATDVNLRKNFMKFTLDFLKSNNVNLSKEDFALY